MDLQEHYDPDADQQQRVQTSSAALLVKPGHQLGNHTWRIERRRGLEHHSQRLASFIECRDAVGGGFIVATMPGVLITVSQQVAMQLPEVVLGRCNVLPGRKPQRSEEHTSELQSLMRISYAVFCLKNKKQTTHKNTKQ